MLSVVTWLWPPPAGYRSTFTPEHVNVLAKMVARHYPRPHRFLCVTDLTAGFDAAIEVIPDRHDFANVPNPYGGRNPTCYRRLRLFAPDAGATFGERFVSLDLDTVITGELAPLWDRPEDVVFWADTNPTTFYNGSMMLLRAGTRPQVWTTFDPKRSPQQAKAAGRFGSDQGWISYCLGKGEAKWTAADGVYSFRLHVASKKQLPPNARVVMFHGLHDPWMPHVQQQHPWIREHYQ
jgi:hypothetical protein